MKSIDLGREYPSGCCAPVCAPEKREKSYPSVYLEGKENFDLPDEGVMTVKFRKCRDSKSTPRDGDDHYETVIDLMEIVSVKGESTEKEESTAEALDKLKEEAEKE